MTTQDWVRERALGWGWTWRPSSADPLEVTISKPGVGEVLVGFAEGGAIRWARTKAGEITEEVTGPSKRDKVLAVLRPAREVSRG